MQPWQQNALQSQQAAHRLAEQAQQAAQRSAEQARWAQSAIDRSRASSTRAVAQSRPLPRRGLFSTVGRVIGFALKLAVATTIIVVAVVVFRHV
jgi:hypothetical protein